MLNDTAPKFPTAKRELNWQNSEGPGPAKYNVRSTEKYFSKKAKNGSFNKSKKKFWLDQQPKAIAPGPIYNPSKHYISKLI